MCPSSVAPSPSLDGRELACSLSFSMMWNLSLSSWNSALSFAHSSKSET